MLYYELLYSRFLNMNTSMITNKYEMPPESKSHKLMWLMGFSDGQRTNTMEEFKKKVAESHNDGDLIYSMIFKRYGLAYKKKSNGFDEELVAAYIDPDLSNEDIIQMLFTHRTGIPYPTLWTMSFLKHNFDITGHDFGKNLPFIFKRKVNVLETVDPR